MRFLSLQCALLITPETSLRSWEPSRSRSFLHSTPVDISKNAGLISSPGQRRSDAASPMSSLLTSEVNSLENALWGPQMPRAFAFVQSLLPQLLRAAPARGTPASIRLHRPQSKGPCRLFPQSSHPYKVPSLWDLQQKPGETPSCSC